MIVFVETSRTQEIQAVAHNSTVFGQLLKLVSRREFDALAGKHKSRKLYTWESGKCRVHERTGPQAVPASSGSSRT